MRLTGLEVRDLKGLKHAQMKEMRAVNIVIGGAGTGKTTLLEAIFILMGEGNPDGLMKMNALRGANWGGGTPAMFMDGQVKPWWSTKQEGRKRLEIRGGTPGGKGSKSVAVKVMETEVGANEQTFVIPTNGQNMMEKGRHKFHRDRRQENRERQGNVSVDIEFVRDASRKAQWWIQIDGKEGKIWRTGAARETGEEESGLLIGPGGQVEQDDIYRYSTLEVEKREQTVVECLRRIRPEIQSVQVGVVGGQVQLWADIAGTRLVPIGELGTGIARSFKILVALSEQKKGMLLLDEVENGMYYANFQEMWKSYDEHHRRDKTQIVATTHSRECLEAAIRHYGPESIAVYRMVEEDTTWCERLNAEGIRIAIEEGVELR